MRADIAKVFGGHPYEKKYMDLSDMQLFILFQYIMEERKKDIKRQNLLVKEILDVTFKQFKNFFNEVLLFINHKMFKNKLEYEERLQHQKENPTDLTPENFEDIWKELENSIPMEYIVENLDPNESLFTRNQDPELDDLITGWLEKSSKARKEVR